MKYFKLLFLLAVTATLLVGCGKNETPVNPTDAPTPTTAGAAATPTAAGDSSDANAESDTLLTESLPIQIAAMKGPTAIGMVRLMEQAQNGETVNPYTFTIAGTADEITAKLIQGEIPIAAVPCNLASVLYNRTEGGVKVAAINTLGVLYIVETGDSIQSVEDLRGKTIYSTGKGTTPEFTLNYLLSAAGLDPETDVTIEFRSEATEVASILSESEDAVAMLPQPYVTTVMMANDKVRIALDVTAEWETLAAGASSVVTGVVVVNADFLAENQAAVDTFLAEYALSAAYATEHVEEAAALVEQFDIFKAAVAKKAIPYCNIVLIEGEDMKQKISGYLETLYAQNSDSVGGALPAEDFYYLRAISE